MKSSRHHRPSEAEAMAATAAAWLAQRDDGLTPAQAAEFARWRAADVRHEAAVQRLEATWSALQGLHEYRPEAARHPDCDLLTPHRPVRRRAPLPALAGTLALAAALGLIIWWPVRPPTPVEPPATTHATTVDGYQRVALADGSLVELNAATEIRVHFAPEERRVELRRGEAHFTVARNPARPFRVVAGPVSVRAVGTAFNVRLGGGAVEVLVTEGKVAVAEPAPLSGATPRTTVAPAHSGSSLGARRAAELGPHERLVLPAVRGDAAALPAVEKLSEEMVRAALAWQGPRLVFTDTPLLEAIAQFNRRNPVWIELADPDLGALPIAGSFRADNVDAFVRLLATGGDVVVEHPAPARIRLRKAGPSKSPD